MLWKKFGNLICALCILLKLANIIAQHKHKAVVTMSTAFMDLKTRIVRQKIDLSSRRVENLRSNDSDSYKDRHKVRNSQKVELLDHVKSVVQKFRTEIDNSNFGPEQKVELLSNLLDLYRGVH